MPPTVPRATATPPLPRCLVEAVREELRCLLAHPAIAAERRRNAELFLIQCLDVARLLRWQQLVLQECATWEDETLAAEQAQDGKRNQHYNESNC